MNKLLPFSLMISLALPFIAKADEQEQPKPVIQYPMSTEHKEFQLLVASAAYIEKNKPEICTPHIKAFLNAIKTALKVNSESRIAYLGLIKKLDIPTIAQLKQEYLDANTQELLVQHKEKGEQFLRMFNACVALTAVAIARK